MGKKLQIFILLLVLSSSFACFSQQSLKIVFTRFGMVKRYDIHSGDILEYKLKGQHFYHKNKIVNMQDSFIVFSNSDAIELNQLKVIRLNKSNYVARMFRKFFIRGGAIFFVLNTVNNGINSVSPAVDSKAALIAGGLITTGLLIREIGFRRIPINKRKYLKIVDVSFNNLTEKPEK